MSNRLPQGTDLQTGKVVANVYQDIAKANLVTIPAASDTLVGKDTTDTLTNKRLTSPKINEDVQLTALATDLNLVDDNDFLAYLIALNNFWAIPTNAAWAATVAGGGASLQKPDYNAVYTTAAASDTALLKTFVGGFNLQAGENAIQYDFDKAAYFVFGYEREIAAANAIARVQIKSGDATALADLDKAGFGIKVINMALWGESYGSGGQGLVNLNTTLTTVIGYQIIIKFTPATSIQWYVNGVLVGTQSTANLIPAGQATGTGAVLVHSIINGASAVAVYSYMYHPVLWQAR